MRLGAPKFLAIALSILVGMSTLQAVPLWPWSRRPTPTPVPSPTPRAADNSPAQLQRAPLPPAPRIEVAPGVVASANDTAHFLAGMPVSSGSPLGPFAQTATWQEHSRTLEERFTNLIPRFQKIAAWRTAYLPESNEGMPVAFYMFSGPDFLYVDQFFPNASVYVLCGTEPIRPPPDPLHLADMSSALANLQNSMNSLLRFSFFITKDMNTDLQQPQLKGVLPIFYVLIARADKTIVDVTFVALNRSGTLEENGAGKTNGMIPGVRI